MKRTVVVMRLPEQERHFQIDVQEPGIVRSFLMGYEEKKVLSGVQLIGQEAQRVLAEIPSIMVEIDPDAPKKSRTFVVVQMGQIIESDHELKYHGTVQSKAANGALFHLFEEITDA